jgi:hypothetical protein
MSRSPRPRPSVGTTPGERQAAVDERRARALEEPLDARLRSAEVYPILEVRNPLHGTVYLVLLPEFPSTDSALCTCTDFARRGLGTCKHIEAGHRWLIGHPGTTPLLPPARGARATSGIWREIDRRLAALPNDRSPESGRVRRPGRTLFERPKRG